MSKISGDLMEHVDSSRPLTEADIDVRRLPEEGVFPASVRRGSLRPTKRSVTIRLDTDIVEWFKAGAANGGYQTAINRALRTFMERHG